MKLRAVRRDHAAMVLLATMFGMGLIAVNTVWPAAFTLFIAIGGVVGALMVVYEVRLTKRLAQAEFIRDLQTGFASAANIGALWSKLLLKEPVTQADRPLVSSYLTFFETLHLLVARGVLELDLIDDLFRNRFFTAVGDPGVLRTALVSQAGSFANIHDLIARWHDHLVADGTPIHQGYYAYIRALAEAKGYEITPLTVDDLSDVLALQEEVLAELRPRPWLRANDDAMLKECLDSQISVGAWRNGRLVSFAALYDDRSGSESIRGYFTSDPTALALSVNLKVVMTLPSERGNGLSRTLVELLEQQAADLGKTEILCTIHPGNKPSQRLFGRLGYHRIGNATTTYGARRVYARTLPVVDRRWAR